MGILSWFCMASSHQSNKKKKLNRETKSPWCDLPDDILSLIMSYLHYSDQIRFRAVCKSWRSKPIYGSKSAVELPWLFSYHYTTYKARARKKKNKLCYLYDPSNKRKYTITLKKLHLVGANALASNNGWLLFSKPQSPSASFPKFCSLFFYNPFTNRVIDLPALTRKREYFYGSVLFSETPNSPDCVIFVVKKRFPPEKFCISSCSPRDSDSTWTEHCLEIDGDILGVAYAKGVLYCAFSQGVLGEFNNVTKEWKVHNPRDSLLPPIEFLPRCLIESEGNLLMMYYDYLGDHWHAFVFDWYQMKWFLVDSLGDKMLFVDYKQCNLVLSVEEGSDLASTIHQSDWCRSFYIRGPWSSSRRRGSPPQPYNWSALRSGGPTKIWVQPPRLR